MHLTAQKRLSQIGWYEWVSLPQLGLPAILAKVDTGAKTSALHAYRIETVEKKGATFVSFSLHPERHSTKSVDCEAELFDRRVVMDSGGHVEERYVIKTLLVLGEQTWPIEVTLTNRDTMSFRMLLGRTALRNRFIINPAKQCLMGKNKKKRQS